MNKINSREGVGGRFAFHEDQRNKNMKSIVIAKIGALCILSPSVTASAAPVPWIGSLSSGSSVTIPSGKILLIEQISVPPAQGVITLRITGPAAGGIGSSFSGDFVYNSSGTPGMIGLPSPIRLGPGMRISHSGGPSIMIFGIALETQDFFAAVSPSIRSVTLDGSQLTAIVDSRATSPTRIVGESSTNLQAWTQSGVNAASSVFNSSLARITTSEDVPRKFVRARAVRRFVGNVPNRSVEELFP